MYNENIGHIWIERFLSNFTKFYHDTNIQELRIGIPNDSVLQKIQKEMWNKYGDVVIDMQGGYEKIKNNQFFVLCDIELYSTCEKYCNKIRMGKLLEVLYGSPGLFPEDEYQKLLEECKDLMKK